MSSIDFKSKRTDNNQVLKMIREIMRKSPQNVFFSAHAKTEMEEDNLIISDIVNILESDNSRVLTHKEELKNGSYRYQFGTSKIIAVISFWPNGKGFNVVTAWRK